jgi:hypothetical protein
MKRLVYILVLIAALPFWGNAQERKSTLDSLVEVSGVTLTADSTLVIPNVSIVIKGKQRGTISNDQGVFSIVAMKGDVLVFRAIGFKTRQVQVPAQLSGNHYAIAQLMAQDTTYLPLTIVKPYPTKEEFKDAFLHWQIPNDRYDIARSNTELEKLQNLMYYTSPDGGEGVNQSFNQQFRDAQYKGGFPPMNIFNPLAWAKFIQAIKNGDFKRDK